MSLSTLVTWGSMFMTFCTLSSVSVLGVRLTNSAKGSQLVSESKHFAAMQAKFGRGDFTFNFFSDSSIQNYLYILDGDFEPERDESDDEETIAKEEAEAGIDEVNN